MSTQKEKKTGVKRKRVVLTIQQKIEICAKLGKGISHKEIMREYNIGKSTVFDIRAQSKDLTEFYQKSESIKNIENRRTLQPPKLELLDSALYEWFSLRRSEGIAISGPLIIEKAKEIYKKMNLSKPCSFSDGWLSRFKVRHGIRKLKLIGDNPSVSEATEEILPDISTVGIPELSVDQSLQEDDKSFVKGLTIDFDKCASVSSIANAEESTVEPCEDIKPIIISVVGNINETNEHIHSTMTSVDAIPVNLPVPVSETQEDSGPSSTPLPSAYIFEKVNDLVTNSNMTTNESCKILLESARTSVGCTETFGVPAVVEDSNKHLHVSVSSKNTPPSVSSSLNTAIPIVNTEFQPKLDIDILREIRYEIREIKQVHDAFQQKANKFMAKQIRLMEKQIENQNIIIQLLKNKQMG